MQVAFFQQLLADQFGEWQIGRPIKHHPTIHLQEQIEREAPLAARMRPRTLDQFVGQEHIVGPGRLLRRAIQADQLSSVIFYGPPGTGKTTLAMVIANTTQSHFITVNAVLSGVKDIREAIAAAAERQARQTAAHEAQEAEQAAEIAADEAAEAEQAAAWAAQEAAEAEAAAAASR